MADRNGFTTKRRENMQRNAALLENLGVNQQAKEIHLASQSERPKKRRKVEKTKPNLPPTRTSARIASAPPPSYDEDSLASGVLDAAKGRRSRGNKQRISSSTIRSDDVKDAKETTPTKNLQQLQASWSSWEPVASLPARDEAGVFHFSSHPDFTPNKSPEEVIREGCFGGSYFRPLFSKKLGISISNDYLELPSSWTSSVNISKYLTSPTYDPEINKFKVTCGQSIEEWEAAGWINHDFDVRGWFQWYCCFFMGRRCEDDARQVGRWRKCVGPTGRWRRMLLKKYVSAGVREVVDDGAEEDAGEVSPVMHQTCHHWAFMVTQEVLDEYWRTGN